MKAPGSRLIQNKLGIIFGLQRNQTILGLYCDIKITRIGNWLVEDLFLRKLKRGDIVQHISGKNHYGEKDSPSKIVQIAEVEHRWHDESCSSNDGENLLKEGDPKHFGHLSNTKEFISDVGLLDAMVSWLENIRGPFIAKNVGQTLNQLHLRNDNNYDSFTKTVNLAAINSMLKYLVDKVVEYKFIEKTYRLRKKGKGYSVEEIFT